MLRDLEGLGRGLLSRAGFMSRPYGGQFSAFHAASEHLEVSAPPGTLFSAGQLVTISKDSQPQVIDSVRRGSSVAHLHCAHSDTDSSGAREFEVRLRAAKRGWLLHALLSVLVTTALLGAAWTKRIDLIRDANADAGLIAISLGVGAVAVVYLARPNEHAMATRLLEGPRIALFATAAAALATITLLPLVPGDPHSPATFDGPSLPRTRGFQWRWLPHRRESSCSTM